MRREHKSPAEVAATLAAKEDVYRKFMETSDLPLPDRRKMARQLARVAYAYFIAGTEWLGEELGRKGACDLAILKELFGEL